MCSAPNVYMFVYILIGTHMLPLIAHILTTVCRYVVKVTSGNNVTMLCTSYVPSCQAFLAALRHDLHVVLYASVYWHVPVDYIILVNREQY